MKVVVLGPTGVGKTKMSIELAKWLNADVINLDAVQVYKDLNIGSAKVTREEMEGVKHYLLDIKSPDEEYNVRDFQKGAREIFEKNPHKNFIVVGGTGLYASALFYDYVFLNDKDITLDKYTNEELYDIIKKNDKDIDIHVNNRVRMERILKRNDVKKEAKLLYDDVVFVGLTTDRENLYSIINKRVDKMIDDGLIEEVKCLKDKYKDSLVLKRAIGYKEVIEYLDGNINKEEMIDLIKKNSRHYAKRQYTWFNNKMDLKWFTVDYEDFNKTIESVKEYIISCHKH